MRWLRALFVCVVPLSIAMAASCKRKSKPVVTVEETYGTLDDGVDAAVPPKALSGRCRQEAELPVGFTFELGEQASLGPNTLVAVASGSGPSRMGKVLTLDGSGQIVAARDLGNLDGDAPPPVLTSHGAAWAAAFFRRGSKRESEVVVSRDGKTLTTVVQQQSDDAYGLSVGLRGDDALLAWDEDQPRGNGGHIRVALIRAGAVVHSGVVSDAASDVDAPQLVSTAAGFAMTWVNRRALSFSDASAERLESTGQMAAYEWIEFAALDAQGQLTGRAAELTSREGHTRASALAGTGDGAFVAIRTDDASLKGSARLLFGGLAGAHVLTTVAQDGVGRSVPALIRGEGGSWAMQTASEMDLPMIWFYARGAWSGSREESIADGRAIRLLGARRLLVAFGGRGTIARFVCE